MKTIVIAGARARVGRHWLARAIGEMAPGAVRVRIPEKDEPASALDQSSESQARVYPPDTSWSAIAKEVESASLVVIESNRILEQLSPDCAIYLEGTNPDLADPLARSKSDIVRGTAVAAETVAALAGRLALPAGFVRRIAWLAGARPSPVSGLIMAGGRSRRMGIDKAFLNLGDATAIEVLHQQLKLWCDRVFIVTGSDRQEQHRGYDVILDEVSGQGPFMGLVSGLAASPTEVNLVVACDIPLLEPCLLATLLAESDDHDIVIASLPASHGDQPLLGVYKKAVLPAARRLLAEGHRRVADLFPECETGRVVAEDDCWYTNLNTPREYQRFLERSRGAQAPLTESLGEGEEFGPSVRVDVVRVRRGIGTEALQPIATEVPCTITGNGVEVATLLCSPSDLKALAAGFLFSSGFINAAEDLKAVTVDETRWVVACDLDRTPSRDLLARRMYTPGCGRGVVYSSSSEAAVRQPLETSARLSPAQVGSLARWLQQCSPLFRSTGGVHSAAISDQGEIPVDCVDDIARHCAVDKVIGKRLLDGRSFDGAVLLCSGRISSEILHKARRAGIAIVISRGGPTHQAVLRAKSLGITLVGFARGEDFTVYSHPERIRVLTS